MKNLLCGVSVRAFISMTVLLTSLLTSMQSQSQTCYDSGGNKIELPDYAKLVIVPFWIDVDHLYVKQPVGVDIKQAIESAGEDRSDEWDGVCEPTFSPGPEDADCVCERKLVVSPSVRPAWCEDYPY